ncbi:MAG TPA: hypothetical protein VHK47_22810 [Polyangia bacterium]|jgi:hypothetical protein|nr:hypothetical protein [Polyangia bacterium]
MSTPYVWIMGAHKKRAGWKGEAVQPAPTGVAEAGADRAAGRSPERVTAGREVEPLEQQPEDAPRRAASHEPPAEKIDEAAEEHRERVESPDDRPARGHL